VGHYWMKLNIICADIFNLFSRYLEEFEKKIPHAEMLELQVFMFFFIFTINTVIFYFFMPLPRQ